MNRALWETRIFGAVLLVLVAGIAAVIGRAASPLIPAAPAALTLSVLPGWDPIVRYDIPAARLTVTRHLRADAEVCLYDTCKPVAEWLAR